MLTPTLEKLVLSGNATYNTFVVGGTEKHILNVPSNRFIIITDITYFSQLQTSDGNAHITRNQIENELLPQLNTQLKVFSNKSVNNFVFRNNFNIAPTSFLPGANANNFFFVTPTGSVKLDTYLIHESDVSFTFSLAKGEVDVLRDKTPVKSIAYPPPFDYGKGDAALDVRLIGQDSDYRFQNTVAGTVQPFIDGKANSLQLQFPIGAATALQNIDTPVAYPIVLISYVEIYGNPTNVSATL